MRARISVDDFSDDPGAILDRVRQGDSFLIEQDGDAVAALEPVGPRAAATWRSLAAALENEPSADPAFADDLEDIQRNQPAVPTDAWHSESTRACSSR
jgi:antitoxin (DNA-binding transcriptional repressor) of toxin-antitoxin stability system